jgi:hypothetical protein
MAMTDASQQQAIARFFEAELLPLADKLKAQGVSLLDAGPQLGAKSYYITRPQRRMTPADFEQGGLTSAAQAPAEMQAVWSAAAGHPLAPLAQGVAKLAGQLKCSQEQSSDVSTFIYAMY